MKSRNVSLISLMLIAACSKTTLEKISLVCQGTEVTSGTKSDGTRYDPESTNVIRTIVLEKQEKKILNGLSIIEFDKPNSGDRTEVTELTDVLKIDGSREIYKESSITSLLRKTTSNNSGVAVTNERITANQEIRVTYGESKDHELNHFDNYSISIDRVSGAFKEVFLQGGIGEKKTDSFRVETNGMCKKAEQKF